MTKVVVPFPVEHHNIDPKEDYFELCRDVLKGEMISTRDMKPRDVIRELRGQKVHAHGRGLPFPELAAFFARKSVYTPHNNHLGASGHTRMVRKFIFNRYDWIAAQTEYGKRNYICQGVDRKKVVVLPIPINFSFFSKPSGGAAFRKKYGLGKDPFVLCVSARKSKNPMVIIKAARMAGMKVVFTGHKSRKEVGPGYEWLLPEDAAIKCEGKDVIFTGKLDRKDLLAALDAADVFVNSSDDGGECFALAVYEAAAAGVPLCLPDFGVFENFKGAALFHRNLDSRGLAANFRRYVDNPRIARGNSTKAKKIAKKFDYPIVRKMYERFYRKIGFIGDGE